MPLSDKYTQSTPEEVQSALEAQRGQGLSEKYTSGRAEPGFAEKVTAMGRMAAGSIVEMAPVVPAVSLGIAAGSGGGPATMALGAGAGLATGIMAGHQAREATFGTLEDLPEELRPYGVWGETFGAAVPFIAAQHLAGRFMIETGQPLIDKIIRAASPLRQPPVSGTGRLTQGINYLLRPAAWRAEAGSAALAASAGAVAESIFPGSPWVRFTAEGVGGALHPMRYFEKIASGTSHAVRRAYHSMSDAGKQSEVGKMMRDAFIEIGNDNPRLVARLLREDPRFAQVVGDVIAVSGAPDEAAAAIRAQMPKTTTAMEMPAPPFVAIEAKLRESVIPFGKEALKAFDDAMFVTRASIRLLERSGDPRALRLAAKQRANYYRSMIAGRLAQAEANAVNDAAEIFGKMSDDELVRGESLSKAISTISRKYTDAVFDVTKEARAIERALWADVSKDARLPAPNTLDMIDELKRHMRPTEGFPRWVSEFVESARKTVGPSDVAQGFLRQRGEMASARTAVLQPVRSEQLLNIRHEALAQMREAMSRPNGMPEARRWSMVAQAALDDLTEMSAADGGDALTRARTFSFEFNESFTRTFAGGMLQKDPSGARRIAPELALRMSLGSGREKGALQMAEVEAATRFLDRRDIAAMIGEAGIDSPDLQGQMQAVFDGQSAVLRLAAGSAVDPVTGRVSREGLGTFLRDNAEVLERFPAVRDQIVKALKSDQAFERVQRFADKAGRVVDERLAFAQAAQYENPIDAMGAILTGNAPVRGIQSMATTARKSGAAAVEGLRMTALDYAFEKSGADFDPSKLKAALFDPVRAGRPSLSELLVKGKIFSADEMARVEALLDRAESIVTVMQAKGGDIEALQTNPDLMLDMVARWAGAQAGGASAVGGTTGTPLVMAGALSQMSRKLMHQLPVTSSRQVLLEAARNPDFAALLLEKYGSPAKSFEITRDLHAYLAAAGIILVREKMEQAMVETGVEGGERSAALRQRARQGAF